LGGSLPGGADVAGGRERPLRGAAAANQCATPLHEREHRRIVAGRPVEEGYTHRRIKHHARVYVDGDVHTQTIDGFFGLFKTGLRGAHHAVSHKWLQGYLNEWAWRYNRRDSDVPMFYDLLDEAVTRTTGALNTATREA
jgi:hypothetical protein